MNEDGQPKLCSLLVESVSFEADSLLQRIADDDVCARASCFHDVQKLLPRNTKTQENKKRSFLKQCSIYVTVHRRHFSFLSGNVNYLHNVSSRCYLF